MNPIESSDAARLSELDAEYEILGELGRGGTSVVYRAREHELGRDVAIKVVRATHVTDAEAVARLEREARLVAALRHPNIVPLLGVRHLSDGLALIMQYVPGRTLRRALREEGRLPIPLVEHVLRQIASALDYAHNRHGIVHRDIKPENIYLDDEVGRAVLADFGIARSTDGESTLTVAGTALGTPAYMSPEQIDGTQLDGRSDLYSLGLVAHEMLTGRQPWAGHNLYTIIYKQKHQELPHVSEFRTDVPLYLLDAVDTLLRKHPGQRCPDAGRLLALLSGEAHAPVSYAAQGRHVVPQEMVGEDVPTLRYQRPTIVHNEEHPTLSYSYQPLSSPVPEPVTAESAVMPASPESPEPPEARHAPAPRGRGGLVQQADAALASAGSQEDAEASIAGQLLGTRKARLVAGFTLFLVLSAAATVVAMMGGDDVASDEMLIDNPAITEAQPNENAEAALLKAATANPELRSGDATDQDRASRPARRTRERNKKEVDEKEADEEEEVAPIPVPEVQIPRLAISSLGQPITAADFTSAGVLTAPPEEAESNASDFIPRTVEPRLTNRPAVERALAEYYPPMLRDRRVSATVHLRVLVDSSGHVERAEILESSGTDALDRAAARVVDVMRFAPAMSGNRKVSAWIEVPIRFDAD